MGLEATWSLVDIPADARDAAQAAARREGLSVGEWLTRRILKRFSELNRHEQQDAFIALRNHVAELADRLGDFEDRSRDDPMREALRKLHQGLERLNDELVRTAGHSTIQISQLSASLEALNGRVDELRQQDAESRSAFDRRTAQLQEFVDGMNLRHSAETRAVVSRVDSLGETLAESRRLIANERSAIERLEENLTRNDSRYGGTFRAFHDRVESITETVQRTQAATSESSAALDQRITSLQAELGSADSRAAEEQQLTATKVEKLQSRVDDFQADVTGMCGALDRRVLLSQQALQSLDSRHTEMAHSLTRSVESVAAQLETVRAESAQGVSTLEARLAQLETSGTSGASASVMDSRLAAIETQLSDLAHKTDAAASTVSALLPRADAIETQVEQLQVRLENEIQNQQEAVEQLKSNLVEQTLDALGAKLEAEGKKQQAAIIDLKNGLLNQLSQAFDERAEAEEHKQQDVVAQLQSNFASAIRVLGQTFESESRKQQEAIAELKASLPSQPEAAQNQDQRPDVAPAVESTVVQHAFVQTEIPAANVDTPPVSAEENVPQTAFQNEEPVLELTTLADPFKVEHSVTDEHVHEHAEAPPQIAAIDPPPYAASNAAEHPDFVIPEPAVAHLEQLAPAGATAFNHAAEEQPAQALSYLSAARQSLHAAAARDEHEHKGKSFFNVRFPASLPLFARKKGQATSYALVAGIVLVAVLAIIVGANELMSRRATPTAVVVHPLAAHGARLAAMPQAARHHVLKNAARPMPSVIGAGQDRTAALAKAGDAQAQLLMGLRYLGKNDSANAAAWLERAALRGVPVAQYRLATLYASGRGIPADKVKAFHWYLSAAQAGNRKAMSNLAVAYAEGDGTAKNPQEAGRWFLKAAQLGLADAQFDLAILYERGLGVPQNLTDAYRWYVIAAKSGDKESKDRVDALSSQLATEDRAAAEMAAAEFKPLPMNARANEAQ